MENHRRVVVVTSDVPFVEGGHLIIARSTVQALKEFGCEADLILTPQNRFGRQFPAYLATRLTDVKEDGLGRKIHQVISFRFPSFAVKHPSHTCWLNHRMREYYDLWDAFYAQLGLKTKIKEILRKRMIHIFDTHLLKHNVTKLFAQSKTIQERLRKWGNIQSEVLYPPPPQRNYKTDSYQNYVFSISRLQKLKRLDLLVDAFKHVQNKELKAVIIGEGPELQNLSQKIKENNLEARVSLQGSKDEEVILSHYARCLAVFFSPLREDYGLITGEAFASQKTVITTSDSGGPAELVNDGKTGFILDPDPKKIAEKIDQLAEEKDLAERMGKKAYEFISRLTWEDTIKKLITV
ncbi:MAG: glycosyltransferase [Candidatus Aminicenantes bacterium]|nr:MAG: glycosyltransferase [Candidatus Aminicenantes bacterium]